MLNEAFEEREKSKDSLWYIATVMIYSCAIDLVGKADFYNISINEYSTVKDQSRLQVKYVQFPAAIISTVCVEKIL